MYKVKHTLIIVLALFVSSCGYELLQYQSNPSITIKVDVTDASHSSIRDTLSEVAKENNLKFAYRDSFLTNGYVVYMWNKRIDMFATPVIYESWYSISFNNSRIPWRKMSDEELLLLAKEFETELLKIENVKLVSFEVFD